MKNISRRSFVTTAAAGVAAFGAMGSSIPSAQAQPIETKSEWDLAAFNDLANHPARVKQVFDSAKLGGSVFDHARNSLNGLRYGFGVSKDQIQIVIALRGPANLMNFDDYIWKKYRVGALFHINDPKTGKPAERNVFYPGKAGVKMKYASDNIESPHSIYNDASIQALQYRGVRLVGCHMATEGAAQGLAHKNHIKQAQAVYQDMIAHTLPNVLIVAAAVAAVALLQTEGHYSYLYI
jgi:hypothetical protein